MKRTAADQVVVQLKAPFRLDAGAKQAVLDLLPANAVLDRHFDDGGMAVVRLPRDTDVAAVIRRLHDHETIQFAEPVYIDSGSGG